MEQEPILIERKEAAHLLSVTPQTISNMAERGIIHPICRNKKYYYPYSEIKALAAFPETHSAGILHEGICRMEAEMKDRYTITEQEYNKRKQRFIAFHGGEKNWYRFKEIASALLKANATSIELPDREMDILNALLELKPLEEIEKELGINTTTVNKLFRRGIKRVTSYTNRYYLNLKERNRQLETDNESLRRKNEYLEKRVNELTAKLNLSEIDRLQFTDDKEDVFNQYDRIREMKTQPPFNIRITDCRLSGRLNSFFRYFDEFKTLGDLVELTEEEFRKKMRKVKYWGDKSTDEIISVLEKNGLRFGMMK